MKNEKAKFEKGSFCILGGCLEIRINHSGAAIRRSSNKKKVIRASRAEWDAFVKSVKAGEFDLAAK